MSEYIATFKTSRQISYDEWETFNPVMKINDTTTIEEIKEWYLTFFPTNCDKSKIQMDNLKIIELLAKQ